jgi:hypothetical protein
MTAKKTKTTGANKAKTGKTKPKLAAFETDAVTTPKQQAVREAAAKKLARLEALDPPGATPEPSKTGATAEADGAKEAAPAATKKAKAAKPERMSALDAAAKVLQESKEPMNAKALIEAMAAKGYWTSPGGKTPQATLSAAIQREISVKGKDSRFKKPSKGHFAVTGV